MAFKLNEKTLEPHNGDYIAFLKEIEKGNAKVSGLTVSVNSDMPGMVTVRRANESDQAPSSPGFIAKNKNAMPALLRLAGSVIAQVFNMLAAMPGNVIAFIIISMLGNAMNFGLNLLGCYVHDLRLQCLEFFNKFYVDGGKPFRPMTLDTEYVDLQ